MTVGYPTKVKLALRSGDRCALPNCGQRLTSDSEGNSPVLLGEAAHIAGEHAGNEKRTASARYDPGMSDDERNACANLIYACPTCHTKIDAIPQGEQEYPVTRLLQLKNEHERRVHEAIAEGFAEVGFVELEQVTHWATALQPKEPTRDYSLLRVQDKIEKNQLTSESRSVIVMGLSVANEVGDYIASVAQTDQDFPERLTAGFLAEYFKLVNQGLSGDALFDLMCRFSQRGFERQAQRSAGLAVLIHLFESCDVFEK